MSAPLTPADAKDVKRWLDEGRAVLIDIREPDEHAREHIAAARPAPLSGMEAHDFSRYQEKIAVFHCRSGMRTQANAAKLGGCGFVEAYFLDGGIEAWKQAGLPVRQNMTAPLEIMRQVQIVAGALILLGIALGTYAHPAFYGISALVGAGLFFAGASGWCAMALLLKAMPWNQPRPTR